MPQQKHADLELPDNGDVTVREKIVATIERAEREQGKKFAILTDELLLVDSGFDSFSFALVVAILEDELGVDPFSESEVIEAPQTFGDFVRLYERSLDAAQKCS
jgi:acyl carrier protein